MTRNTPKIPKRIMRKDDEKIAEATKSFALSINIPLELRIEQASKPLYLIRYE